MLRQYNEGNPQIFEYESKLGNMLEIIMLPVTLREEYLEGITKSKTTKGAFPLFCKIIKSIDGRPTMEVLSQVTHAHDLQVLYNDIVAVSWLPENVSGNLQPSPESSKQEKAGDAGKIAEPEDDNVSITQPLSFAKARE